MVEVMYTSCIYVVEIHIMVCCCVSFPNCFNYVMFIAWKWKSANATNYSYPLPWFEMMSFYFPFIQTYLLSLPLPQCTFFFDQTNSSVLRSERKTKSSCVISVWMLFSQYKPLLSVCLSHDLMGFFIGIIGCTDPSRVIQFSLWNERHKEMTHIIMLINWTNQIFTSKLKSYSGLPAHSWF